VHFVPPRCPNPSCDHHSRPSPRFYEHRGYYQPKCRKEPVPRFRCRTCRRGFSRQTFRYDYCDHRPDCNAPVFIQLVSGTGLRQAARIVGLNPQSVQDKLVKMARTLRRLQRNLCPQLSEDRTYLLDEEETFETASIRPLTMPVVIERSTWFVVATAVGSIRRLAKPGSARRAKQDLEEKVARRPDQSRACVQQVLDELARTAPTGRLVLQTDEKQTYAVIARKVFGERLEHETTRSTMARCSYNPLFPINMTMAMTRDNCGRLRRRSWLVTKKGDRLANHLVVFTVYRNYVRRRFNRDQEAETPAKILGLLPRQLHQEEVLAWRQDWGDRSIHPMSECGSHTVRQAMPA